MRLKFYLPLFLLFFSTLKTYSQASGPEYFVTVNGNLYLPINNPNKGVYPILWYDKETNPKLLIGGLGVGLSAFKPLKDKISLKGVINISKHTYWDEPIGLVDISGYDLQLLVAGSSDFSIDLAATAHYFLTERISVGTGLGSQLLLTTLARLPEFQDIKASVAAHRYYKRLMPTLPVELSFKTKKNLFNIRYEYGLLNRYKKDIAVYKKDKFGLLSFELGFPVNQ